MTSALQYAQEQASAFEAQLEDFLRIPSVSADSSHDADVRRCAEWLAAEFERIGMQTVEILETGGHPVVYAHYETDPDAPT
ncbi:MAG: peptidase M20, partial [Bacteroidota bacterium]